MRIYLILLSIVFLTYPSYGQIGEDLFCGKKWYCEMTKDADGTIHQPEKNTQNDFMHFMCDSTFILKENEILLKGRWLFDPETMTITMNQQELLNIPDTFSFHIIDYDEGHLVIMGREGTDNESTAYLFSK